MSPRWWPFRSGREELPDDWTAVASRHLRHWAVLGPTERRVLGERTLDLYADKRWEAARGFTLDDRMRCTIAVQAGLLALGLDADCYRHVQAIIVHSTTKVLHGPRPGPAPGVVTDGPMPVLGLAQDRRGPVVLAWDAVERHGRGGGQGHNVVFHEFAHKLDMLSGMTDGTPPMPDAPTARRWVEVCTAEYERLRRGRGGPLLRAYGGTNPGEFFAVVTEVFFDRPVDLRETKPELYAVLSGFYRQDPAAREESAGRSGR